MEPAPVSPSYNLPLDDDIAADAAPSTLKDTIDDYLAKPPVSVLKLRREGLLGYWNNHRQSMPRVTKFALGILGAPDELDYAFKSSILLNTPRFHT